MNVLLVEDDEEKRDEIIELLRKNFEINITYKMSFQTGKKAIKDHSYDLILLDMDIPTFDVSPDESGGRKQAFGGRMLLAEMARNNIETTVVVVTQFDYFENSLDGLNIKELDEQLKKSFKTIYKGYVQMRGDAIDWKEKLIKIIKSK